MMDRKVSSLSVCSDGSDSSGQSKGGSNLVLEQIGQVSVSDAVSPKCLSSSGNYVCILSGDTHVFLADLRLRADSDCVTTRYNLLALPGSKDQDNRHYLGVSIFTTSPGNVRLALLGERKNKERFVSIVEVVTAGRSLGLGEELSVYDKVSMLGKGLSHITSSSDISAGQGEGDIFVFSNIIRKLKVEEEGKVLKPTSGRVAIPAECMDGTMSVCVSCSAATSKRGFSIISSARTKSAGKNKYQVNWYHGKRDELTVPSSGKSNIKLAEDQEPRVILADPRDARSNYVICNHSNQGTASLVKLVRGRTLDTEPIFTFSFPVQEATFIAGPDKNLFLLVLELSSLTLQVFHLMKTEGYRGQVAGLSACPDLQKALSAQPYHALSCSVHRWQLQPSIAELVSSSRCPYQVSLATLLLPSGDLATEPETGLQYRLRLLGGDQVNDVLQIVLDDLERTFESEEDSLASMTLKMCLNSSPGREGMSQLSAWLMSGRLSSVELFCTVVGRDCPAGSDRLVIQAVQPDSFRNFLVDQDWTQTRAREGTFVLENNSTTNLTSTPASIRTSSANLRTPSSSARSRIPSASGGSHRNSGDFRKSPNVSEMASSSYSDKLSTSYSDKMNNSHCDKMTSSMTMTNSFSSNHNGEELAQAISQVEESLSPLARASGQIRDSIASLERNLLSLKAASGRGITDNGH